MTVGGGSAGKFGDTTLTKVFVGGLAWEAQKEALREHFEKYGEILEAVIISDKVTGRSKGYGFVSVLFTSIVDFCLSFCSIGRYVLSYKISAVMSYIFKISLSL